MNYDKLVEEINSFSDIKVRKNNRGISMVNHENPVSITPNEFDFIQKTIKEFNLGFGFEIATGTGISALAAGESLAINGGILITMDAYIEEKHNSCDKYTNLKECHSDSDGWKLVNNLIEHYILPVIPVVGWSPDDVKPTFLKYWSGPPLDYVFIDAQHFDKNLIDDVNAIRPFVNKNYIFFGHDHHCFSKNTLSQVEDIMGGKIQMATDSINDYGLFYIKVGF